VGRTVGPALAGRERNVPLSYLQLVEVAFVSRFRRLGVPLQKIRKARDYFAKRFEAEYPFAQLRVKTDGHHVLMEMLEIEPDSDIEKLIVGDRDGQLAWRDVVAERFLEFDYEEELALVWHVDGRHSPILIDPRVLFGAPQIRGVPTWAVRGRRLAGEPPEEIAEDFGLDVTEVETALGFEGLQAAA